MCRPNKAKKKLTTNTNTGVLISPQPDQEGNKLQRPNPNFCKPLKKIQNVVRPTRSPRQQLPPRLKKNGDLSIVFFSRVRLKTYQHPVYQLITCSISLEPSIEAARGNNTHRISQITPGFLLLANLTADQKNIWRKYPHHLGCLDLSNPPHDPISRITPLFSYFQFAISWLHLSPLPH